MDIVTRLRDLRLRRRMPQKDVAERSGLGIKTISSFESGDRIDSMKLSQLRRLLDVYGISERDFFDPSVDLSPNDWSPAHERAAASNLSDSLRGLTPSVRRTLIVRFLAMCEAARATYAVNSPVVLQHRESSDWQMLVSRN